ncbi:hypothetical protein K402DRAFT_418158 [Aulographum hederae CBS 113979]|uniref:Uncharacterized protein n=1 Tax=Aulographum hederae CBS 113979 TaxID=1176131 RepID=A0A6G1HA22_9PEZI|nr:hypothetical protein K402DRAFT_418158 [Aulographum hederae CBS 113979]
MKSFTIATVLAASFSLATASSQETVRIRSFTEVTQGNYFDFSVHINELAPGVDHTVGMKVLSAHGVPLDSVSCIAFKDKNGQELGSAVFTANITANIATNPVSIGSIRCTGRTSNNSTSTFTKSFATGTAGTGTGTGTILPTNSMNSTGTGISFTPTATPTGPTTPPPGPTNTGNAAAGLRSGVGMAGAGLLAVAGYALAL